MGGQYRGDGSSTRAPDSAPRRPETREDSIDPAPTTTDDELLATAVRAAEAAAELHRETAGSLDPTAWSEKGTADFVTEVDREAERRIVRVLRERFPHHEILAEEESHDPPAERDESERVRWIIDPLDGTTNFLHQYPVYAVSVAGMDSRGLRVGVVLDPVRGERFEAVRGRGAWRNGERIRVSRLSSWRLALVGTGFPFKREELLPTYLDMFARVLRTTSGVRRSGAAALDLCNLACGRLDSFWELWLMPWDIAAGALIVREAGGFFGPLELGSERGAATDGSGERGADRTADRGADRGVDPTANRTADRGAETLREAIAAARAFAATWEGGGWGDDLARGGAYIGANGELRGELARTLSSS